jgi:hypothetical protein
MANPSSAWRHRSVALALAIPATATAACLSVMAGWQRGGWLPERVLWIAIGVVLVLGAHLLPSLCRSCSVLLRCIGVALWIGCTAATCAGHAVFFLMAQQHAGDVRAASVDLPASIAPTGRSLTAIAHDREATVAQQAHAPRRDRRIFAARLDALDVEASEAKRQEAMEDRATVERDRVQARQDALRVDPVTGRVAALLGVPVASVDLLSGLMFAAVLEGVACFCWVLAVGSEKQPHASLCENSPHERTLLRNNPMNEPVKSAGNGLSNDAGNARSSGPVAPVTAAHDDADPDMDRIRQGIEAGELRATVAGIRQFLGCSQTRAMELRRALTI